MPVDEMLTRMSSFELSEWFAFEQAFGPLDGLWEGEMLRALHVQLQATFRGKDDPEPVPFMERKDWFPLLEKQEEERENQEENEPTEAEKISAFNRELGLPG